jgi:hypothetical protein
MKRLIILVAVLSLPACTLGESEPADDEGALGSESQAAGTCSYSLVSAHHTYDRFSKTPQFTTGYVATVRNTSNVDCTPVGWLNITVNGKTGIATSARTGTIGRGGKGTFTWPLRVDTHNQRVSGTINIDGQYVMINSSIP